MGGSLINTCGLKDLAVEELKHHLWNCDETGFCTAAGVKKILAKRGDRDVQETIGRSGRDYITVLALACHHQYYNQDPVCLSVTDVTHFRNVYSGNETINQYYNAYAGNESPKM